MRSILLYGCETWPVRVADERMLEVFDNDSIRRILGTGTVCHPWNCVAASTLQAYRHCSCKEGSAVLYMPQDVPKVSLSSIFSFPHRLARGTDELGAMGYHDQGRPGTDLRTASLRPRTMEKGLGESV